MNIMTIGTTPVANENGFLAASSKPALNASIITAPTQTVSTNTSKSDIRSVSPLITSDPVSGTLVTQYLNEGGDVRAQIPSTAALAYLRMGLTIGGASDDSGQNSNAVIHQAISV